MFLLNIDRVLLSFTRCFIFNIKSIRDNFFKGFINIDFFFLKIVLIINNEKKAKYINFANINDNSFQIFDNLILLIFIDDVLIKRINNKFDINKKK